MAPQGPCVYAIGMAGHDAVKLGWTANPAKRLRDLQIGCPLALTLLWVLPTSDAPGVEAALHRKFRDRQIQGEWFDLGPGGWRIARQAYNEITGRPQLEEDEPEPPFEPVMAEPARLFLADISPWVMAQPAWARWVTVEHLAQQLKATGLPRWEQVETVKVGRMLDCLFGLAFKTPTRSYAVGLIRVAVLRKAVQPAERAA